jgi:hypothetical protein
MHSFLVWQWWQYLTSILAAILRGWRVLHEGGRAGRDATRARVRDENMGKNSTSRPAGRRCNK